jgi:hypothetical protein
MRRCSFLVAVMVSWTVAGFGELGDTLAPRLDHPAIGYLDHPLRDAVSELNRRIERGAAELKFENGNGYLRSVLQLLHISIESQMAVFSKASVQFPLIDPNNPRTIFFNDSVVVAWMRGGFIELASQDPEQGVVFHMLEQRPAEKPEFIRRRDCNRCHISDASLGVPGMMIRSLFPAPDGMPKLILGGYTTDHRSPFEERWGGWYVTGNFGSIHHMGNTIYTSDDRAETIPVNIGTGYLAPYSDIAALLVFDHQMYMTNLLTRFGWEVRAGQHDKRPDVTAKLRDGARELVDYILFIDEVLLPGKIQSTSGFAEKFSALGPLDSRGRSLRQLDLKTRLMRYPCSYMIYTEAFDSLPWEARSEIYKRLWQVLSGGEKGPKYSRLSVADRQAIAEILHETKKGLPEYFQAVRH